MTIPAEIDRSEQEENARDVEEDASSFHSSILSAEDDEALHELEERDHFSLQRALCRFLLFPCLVIFIIIILFFLIVFGALPMLIASIILIAAYYCCTQDPIAPRVLFAALWNEDNNIVGGAAGGGALTNFNALSYTEEEIHSALLRRKCVQIAKQSNSNEYQALLDNVRNTAAVSLSHDKTENHLSQEQVYLQTPDCILLFSTPLAVEEGVKNKKESWSEISDESLLLILRALERGGDFSHGGQDYDNAESSNDLAGIRREGEPQASPINDVTDGAGVSGSSYESEPSQAAILPVGSEGSDRDMLTSDNTLGSNIEEHEELESSCISDAEQNCVIENSPSGHSADEPVAHQETSEFRPAVHSANEPGEHADTSDLRERGTVCDICLIEYEEGDTLAWSKNTACDHAFHEDCIKGWLPRNPTCPSCRQNYIIK